MGKELKYTFEPIVIDEEFGHDDTIRYQVRLNHEFVCYSTHKDPKRMDEYLKELGFESREQCFGFLIDVMMN